MRFHKIIPTTVTSSLLAAMLLCGCSDNDAELTKVHELTAIEHEIFVEAAGGTAQIQLYANGPVRVEQLTPKSEWVEVDQTVFDGDKKVSVTFAENTSFRRMIKLRFVLNGGKQADTVCVKQYGVVPSLECPTPYKSIKGSTDAYTQFEIKTNIPLEDFEVSTSYIGNANNWVRSVLPEQGILVVDTKPNSSDNICKAVVNLKYVDGWGETFSTNLYITQADKDDKFGRKVSFADVRSMATSKSATIDENILIEGVVISDFHSKNMDVNPNLSYDQVDVSVNDCTAYIESLDGRYGFRLRFDTPNDNVLVYGTRLSLSLNGTIVTRDENPERYTISSLVGENMVESIAGQAIPAKVRKISELTDEDVYTFVSLQNTEFLFKQGSYANVYESYTLKSELHDSQYTNNRMDGWASLLMDGDGRSIYAPINMLCLWRRSGMGVPQGVGTTNGIVVHNQLQRYGNVGRYQIRVVDEEGFNMDWTGNSAYTEYAEWDGDPYKYLFSNYSKLNARYAYNGLESITPSDDISSTKIKPNAELFCENHIFTEAWPLVGTSTYNNPTMEGAGVSTKHKAYILKSDVKGWYRWDNGRVEGYNGLRLEFSTAGINGTRMLVGFSFAAGTIAANTSKTYPAHWCVEYSIDGGATYKLCANSTTGAEYVHMHSLPWMDALLAGNRYNTSSSAGIGLTDHLFFLPSEVFGKSKVLVRIRPYDKILAVLPLAWDGNSETAEINSTTTYDTRLRWGDITLRYM